ncbi:3' terminal RNA ribose 2'-O-methyltransferase Hen1 [Virgisporangium aliadipatigenens]|uniref:Small RNA 2'-O-methyltransferase n=1 Tax=Virgisporangium aliadipatigenens TaxID=741659 RepID=A0A8J3YU79_9ACTN|nr:3' terminal RNA ribose 2'-O-methyltransferase Hen1 [Virgisporangium aliadipatigenens]GIJ50747.1 3' terminal RNA ribose 2'-O-methyltransferase Hen1 [Virgisporangium aliadipatigenens]
MILTVSTTHRPATDLGYLLVKHPDRVHTFRTSSGDATVFFPEATQERCTAALVLDVEPGREFVNDRAFAASSLLAAALNQVFRSALRGFSKDRPELAGTAIPLEISIPAVPGDVAKFFGPLGWTVTASPIRLEEPWGDSRYVDLTLSGTFRLSEALNQVYVLLPVLDDEKHYWVAPDEVDKLLRAGTGWLATHPEKRLIARRYLAHQRALVNQVIEPEEPDEQRPERPRPLAAVRRAAVRAALERAGATRVLDLGCGQGALLAELLADRRYTEIVGVDVSPGALETAAKRLRLERLPERQRARLRMFQGSLVYRDDRLRGYDAAVLMEVVEHLDEPRLPALVDAVFGHAQPETVIVTTPNREFNVRYEGLTGMRHGDHRFEWTRAEFRAWAEGIAGYSVAFEGVGDADELLGAPTQLAVFTRKEKS